MDKRAEFKEWMRVHAIRMRVGIILLVAGSVIYADFTNTWHDLCAILPFGLMLIPGYIEWPFEVRWPQHPAFRMCLQFIPMATPACAIGAYNRFGLPGAIWYTAAFVLFEILCLILIVIWMKRAGLRL